MAIKIGKEIKDKKKRGRKANIYRLAACMKIVKELNEAKQEVRDTVKQCLTLQEPMRYIADYLISNNIAVTHSPSSLVFILFEVRKHLINIGELKILTDADRQRAKISGICSIDKIQALIATQESRLMRVLSKEDKSPLLLKQATDEMFFYSGLIKQLMELQFRSGIIPTATKDFNLNHKGLENAQDKNLISIRVSDELFDLYNSVKDDNTAEEIVASRTNTRSGSV